MIPFKKLQEVYDWVAKNARGECCVLQVNARLLVTPWCEGDMRVIQIFTEGCWQ